MNTKRKLLCIVLPLTFLTFAQNIFASDVPQAGRFQLVAATVYDDVTKSDVKMLFRVDTQTGKTWVWKSLPIGKTKDGQLVYGDGWVEADEDLANEMQHAIQKQK